VDIFLVLCRVVQALGIVEFGNLMAWLSDYCAVVLLEQTNLQL